MDSTNPDAYLMQHRSCFLLLCAAYLAPAWWQEKTATISYNRFAKPTVASVARLEGGILDSGQAALFYQKGLTLENKNPEKAFQAFETAMHLARQDKENELYLKSVNKLAALARNINRETDAFKWIKDALLVFGSTRKEDLPFAELNYFAGVFFAELTTEYDVAIQFYERARSIRIKVLGEWHEDVAKCYNGLGDIYKYNKFNFLEAEKCLEKALEIREHIHLDDDYQLARNYYSLAATNRSQMDYEKAIAYAIKTIELVKKTKDPVFLDRTYSMVANIYRDMNQMDDAKEYYQKAIALHPSTHEPQEMLAGYYMNLGETFRLQKNNDEALVNFRKGYGLIRQFGVKDKMTEVYLLQQMADALMSKGEDQQFLKVSRELRNLLSDLKLMQSRSAAEELERMGNYFRRHSQPDSALYYFQKSLMAAVKTFHSVRYEDNPTREQIGMDFYVYEILFAKSQLLEDLYHRTKKKEYLMQAIACIELSEKLLSIGRNTIDMEESKWKFMDSHFDLYEKAISQLLELSLVQPGDSLLGKAFYFFERSKSQALTQAVANAGLRQKRGMADSILIVQENCKKTQFSLQDQLRKELSKPFPDESEVIRWRQQIVSVDRQIQQNKKHIEDRFPGYFKVQFDDAVPSLAEIQLVARREKVALLEFFWGTEDIYALGITGDDLRFKRIGKRDSIRVLAAPVIAHLVNEQVSVSNKEFFDFRDNAFQLFNLLIRPFDSLLVNHQRLQIIPDGLIAQVPFEVLISEENKSTEADYAALTYLVKQYDVSYAYSSSLLSRQVEKKYKKPSLLAMGFTGGEFLRSPEPGKPELSGSEKELEALAGRFPAGKFLKGEAATESNFKNLAPDYNIIHLAIHGRGDPGKDYSSSLFFRSQSDSLEDGELHAYELYDLKLGAELAILGSCESGLGKSYRGEGMISMASAFTYSGCQNVLMSLWKVQDKVAMQLMDDFYRELMESKRIDLSLAEAKRHYLAQAGLLRADPKIWAPLVAYGNQLPVFQKERSNFYFYLIGLSAVLLFLFLLRKRAAR